MVLWLTHDGAKQLLHEIRQIIDRVQSPQLKIDQIVEKVADFFTSDICSIYILQSNNELELYATKGLNKDLIHKAKLKLGQGLVGYIAKRKIPLNLSDGEKHPAFCYIPNLGEDPYHGFLGLPILRNEKLFGVLVLQRKEPKAYNQETVKLLDAISLLLAEQLILNDTEFFSHSRLLAEKLQYRRFTGASFHNGFAIGNAILQAPNLIIEKLVNEDPAAEVIRLHTALNETRLSIDKLLSHHDTSLDSEQLEILQTFRMFTYDKGWIARIENYIHNGLTAEAAVQKEQNTIRNRINHIDDPYLRERLADFEDLSNRVLHRLLKVPLSLNPAALPPASILVAKTMGPAQLLEYPQANLAGLILEESSNNSHVAIVARSLSIPTITQISNVSSLVENGNLIIIDTEKEVVHLRPSKKLLKIYQQKTQARLVQQQVYLDLSAAENKTKDGKKVNLYINAGMLVDLDKLDEIQADGVGLLRTEIYFLTNKHLPRSHEQEIFYRSILKKAKNLPVTFRALDVGDDKNLPYLTIKTSGHNPAMGNRAIRFTLSKPALFRMQIRAFLKAAAGQDLHLLLPLVSDIQEITEARNLLNLEKERLKKLGHILPRNIKLGAMIEVPAILWQLDEFFSKVDFASIGGNDLFQFFMAADRHNSSIYKQFDPINISFFRALHTIILKAKEHKKSLTFCGELAGDPLGAMALIGLGIDSLSMSNHFIGAIKAMVLSLDARKLQTEMIKLLNKTQPGLLLRSWLKEFAAKNKVVI